MRAAGKLPSQSPNGDSSPKGGAKSRLPLWGRCPPKEGGEGNPPPARTCAILLMSTSEASCHGRELPGVQPPRIDSGGTPPSGKDASLFPEFLFRLTPNKVKGKVETFL